MVLRSSLFVTLYFFSVFVAETLFFRHDLHDSVFRLSSDLGLPRAVLGVDPALGHFTRGSGGFGGFGGSVAGSRFEEGEGVRNHVFRPLWFGAQLFVAVSTYRAGDNSFVVVGEVSRFSTVPVDACIWKNHNKSSTLIANATILQGGTTKGRIFHTTIVKCTFDLALSSPEGGFLYLVKSDEDRMNLVHVETPEQFLAAHFPPKHNIVFCGPPMHGRIQANVLAEWFAYHAYITQIEHFFLYDYGGINDNITSVLNPFLNKGAITVTRMEDSQRYNSWYFHQQTNNCDCLYRTRFMSRWVLFTDFDEFIHVPKEGQLLHFLNNLDANTPWASMGSVQFHEAFCSPKKEQNETLLERMVWRQAGATCRRPLFNRNIRSQHFCPKNFGHRKVIVNPRASEFMHIHEVLVPSNGVIWNASLDSDFPRINHYRRVLSEEACTYLIDPHLRLSFFHGYFFDSCLRERVQKFQLRSLIGA